MRDCVDTDVIASNKSNGPIRRNNSHLAIFTTCRNNSHFVSVMLSASRRSSILH